MTVERDLWAVVPVKAFAQAKSRLAPQLSPEVRSALACAMLNDVLAALHAVRGLAQVVVVTLEPRAAELATRYRAVVWRDGAADGHTGAVMAAARRLQAEQRSGMLTVPGDIPGVAPHELEALIARHRQAPAFTIAPAHDGRGSNAVAMSPPAAVPLAFGNDSFLPHLAAARRAGIEPVIATGLPGIARDVDCYDDLVALLRMPGAARTPATLDGAAPAPPVATD